MQLVSTFDSQLYGLRSYSYMLQSPELNNPNAYEGWDFAGSEGAKRWDSYDPDDKSFWYNVNTTMVWHTNTYIVGQ